MKKLIYPAIFLEEEVGYSVSFPDLEGCFTEGDTLEAAFHAAKEVLALHLDELNELPIATAMKDVKASKTEIVMLVEADNGADIVYFKRSDVPQFINEGLKNKGYSKYKAAQLLGVDRSYLSYLTKGERVPSVEMAKRIGALLDFDWRIFFAEI